jgi:hypothetical protein
MPKCEIILEPVQTKDRVYVNGETLEADETTVASLVSVGVAIRLADETVTEIAKSVVEQQPTRRRRQQTEEIEEVV